MEENSSLERVLAELVESNRKLIEAINVLSGVEQGRNAINIARTGRGQQPIAGVDSNASVAADGGPRGTAMPMSSSSSSTGSFHSGRAAQPAQGPQTRLEAYRQLVAERQYGHVIFGQKGRFVPALGTYQHAVRPHERETYNNLARSYGFADADEYARMVGFAGGLEQMLSQDYQRIARAKPGFGGFVSRLTDAQFPEGDRAVALIGYQRSFMGGKASRIYGVGELIRQSATRFKPVGGDAYDPSTQQQHLYSGGTGSWETLSIEEKDEILTSSGFHEVATFHVNTPEFDELPEDVQLSFIEYDDAVQKGDKAGMKLHGALIAPYVLTRSRLLSPLRNNPKATLAYNRAVAKLSGQTGFVGTVSRAIFGSGGALMAASRFVVGPIGVATAIGVGAYSAVDRMYEPARSAAGLGYGMGYNPFATGTQVSLGRSLGSRFAALTSFALSGKQAAEARAALEGIGVGGPGSESTYNQYYRSMTDVIKNTQLGADELAPFYDAFKRGGGEANEIAALTKMLRDDLPEAAARSRQSMSAMAAAILQASDAVFQAPFNARTSFEIQRTITSSMAAGGVEGSEGIAGGMNAFLAARVASNTGMSFLAAREEGGLMQAEAVKIMQEMMGNMSGEEFENYRKTERGRQMTFVIENMTGLNVNQQQRIYDIGADRYIAAQELSNAFDTTAKGVAPKSRKELLMERGLVGLLGAGGGNNPTGTLAAAYLRGKGIGKQYPDAGLSEYISPNIDLYNSSGATVVDYYRQEGIIAQIRKAHSDDNDALKRFNTELRELEISGSGVEARDYLRDAARSIADVTPDPNVGILGLIDLTEDAKKLFKKNWGSSDSPVDSVPNESVGPGRVVREIF